LHEIFPAVMPAVDRQAAATVADDVRAIMAELSSSPQPWSTRHPRGHRTRPPRGHRTRPPRGHRTRPPCGHRTRHTRHRSAFARTRRCIRNGRLSDLPRQARRKGQGPLSEPRVCPICRARRGQRDNDRLRSARVAISRAARSGVAGAARRGVRRAMAAGGRSVARAG
jgi:hypothetical protein